MIDLAILAYCIPGILFIMALVLNGKNKFLGNDLVLNAFSIVHALYLLGLTVIILSTADLPVYYMNGRYFAIDRLTIYEILIATTIFSLSAIYARGYVRDLLKKGEIESSNTRLFYGVFNLLFTVIVLSFLANNVALYGIFLELNYPAFGAVDHHSQSQREYYRIPEIYLHRLVGDVVLIYRHYHTLCLEP